MPLAYSAQFFALARAQLTRQYENEKSSECSTEDKDLVLRRVVPGDYHPTRPTWCAKTCRYMEDALRFVVAYHWLGGDQATGKAIHAAFVRGDTSIDQRLQDHAGLVAVGAVRAPATAPCRSIPWEKVADTLHQSYVRRPRSLQQFSEHLDFLGVYVVRDVVRDVREALPELPDRDVWLPAIFDVERAALGFVQYAMPMTVSLAEARVLAVELVRLSREVWPESEYPWTVDAVLGWAVHFYTYAKERS